ncbi:MAG: putative lipid II flippase FtsW [Clostridium sp.]
MKLNDMKKKAGKIDFQIFATIIFIVCIGVVMVYSSSAYYALYEESSTEFFLKKELTWTIVGICVMMFTMSVDYHIYKKLTFWIALITIVLLVAVLYSNPINGATRWLNVAGVSFQPSELAKYVVVAFMAVSIDANRSKMEGFFSGVMLYLGIAGIFAGLILLENNLSIAAIIMIVTFIMILVGGAKIIHLFPLAVGGIVLGMTLIFASPYRMERFLGFLNPWEDASGRSFQLIQSFYALGSGGLTGVGLGQSTQKLLYMPEPYNDFIFAIIGEEFGIIGCLFLMGLFLFLILRGISVAIRAKDGYGLMLATGIISIIAVQAMINIAVVTGTMPVTGVPLPFVSYGGTSMVFNLAAMGVVLNISRQGKQTKI